MEQSLETPFTDSLDLTSPALEMAAYTAIRGERAERWRPMTDARIEGFLADILALEGENADAIREGVLVALTDCADIFKAQEVNRRMKDKAVHACHVLCRARLVEEIQRRKGTVTVEHVKYVLSVIDGPRFPAKDR
jgi:hypothetical protein